MATKIEKKFGRPVQKGIFYIRGVEGVPLVVNRFSEKARQQMVDNQTTKGRKEGKAPRDIAAEVKAARYALPGTFDGFPAVGLKAAMVSAARSVDKLSMEVAKQSFFVPGEPVTKSGSLHGTIVRESLLEIVAGPHYALESVVRVNKSTSMVRVRPAYEPWAMKVEIHFPESVISGDTISLLLTLAGAQVGLGEHRPQRNGENGRFELCTEAEFNDLRAAAEADHAEFNAEVEEVA